MPRGARAQTTRGVSSSFVQALHKCEGRCFMFARFVLRCAPLALGAIMLTSASASSAPPTAPATVVRIDKIVVPGKPLKGWDISWVDAPSAKYYLADRTNASIDVIDVMTNQVINQIGGFVGATGKNDTS